MKEVKAIISAYDAIDKSTTRAALATVVRVEGSSYRRAGARMLVMDNGVWIGGISGGCLEGDALNRAMSAIARSEPTMIIYDTTQDDMYQVGVGLGCNGIIDVLFTPIDYQNENNPVEVLKSCAEDTRKTRVLITIINLEGNWAKVKIGEAILYNGPECLKILSDSMLEKQLVEKITQQIENNKSAPHQFELTHQRKLSAFIEIFPPELHLILMGHQYDVCPLARVIKEIGWHSSLVSTPWKMSPKIASSVEKIYSNEQFNEIVIDEYTAIILMSHEYKTDKINLSKALLTNAPYIGMLGPRVRAEKIFSDMDGEGKPLSEENRQRIYAPAGLDIGGLSPEEIALSLIAEIRAVFSKRDGGFLRLRQDTIHERN